MCGIAGLLDPAHTRTGESLRGVATAMTDALRHRGPDDGGVEVDEAGGVALGNRRLAIVDLSPAGHQPMWSPDRRHLLAYNGELYNAEELRPELAAAGWSFRGRSDTEVLLAALATWGARRTAERAVGMFGFAAWDAHERRLVLGRDRFGEKPVYYGWHDGVLRFGSELTALRADPAFGPGIDRDAVALLLRHTYIPAPHSVYEGVRKLPPASLYTWSAADGERIEAYWSLADVAEGAGRRPFGSEAEADEALDAALTASVRSRLVSDVPLGAFLSGGIDSSLIVALMDRHHDGPVRTFTIGFADEQFDEAPFARGVAEVLGTDHTELEVTPAEAQAVIPELCHLYDEPFADQSQIPTVLLSRLARRDVTVALSGDGGDELFGGYWHHLWSLEDEPSDGDDEAAASAASASQGWRQRLRRRGRGPAGPPPGGIGGTGGTGDRPAWHQGHLDRLASWADPAAVVRGATLPATAFTERVAHPRFDRRLDWMMELDAATFLPDDVLVKVDRATMSTSLEARAPFLDPAVAEVAWRIPTADRLGPNGGKLALRRLLGQFVPTELFERPKMGFNVPIGDWLRGPLREWGSDVLAGLDDDLFDRSAVDAVWADHLAGEDAAYRLWPVLMCQTWLDAGHGDGRGSTVALP
ncbi:MAG: asparagine synthase (glutamine-hydrolyzing) [Acidimicrobiales bacterium]|nr:asparagine synthase (glutamine-hydrolyzing) [Acidimicrobiales bacterium]